MKSELSALLVAAIIALAIGLPIALLVSKDKPTQDAGQINATSSRFTSEEVFMNNNCYSFLVKDHKTGREWLALYKIGVIEVTPPIEKEKP